MSMIAANGRPAAVLGVITGSFKPAPTLASTVGVLATAAADVDEPVHERWMTGRFLGVTGKFWGEPCEFGNTS